MCLYHCRRKRVPYIVFLARVVHFEALQNQTTCYWRYSLHEEEDHVKQTTKLCKPLSAAK